MEEKEKNEVINDVSPDTPAEEAVKLPVEDISAEAAPEEEPAEETAAEAVPEEEPAEETPVEAAPAEDIPEEAAAEEESGEEKGSEEEGSEETAGDVLKKILSRENAEKAVGMMAETIGTAAKILEETVDKTVKTVSEKRSRSGKSAAGAGKVKKPDITAEKVEKAAKTAASAAVETARKAEKAARKAAARIIKAPEHFFELDGKQISTAEIENRIREAYKNEGHRIGNIRTLSVYYNFGERRAYYVVNGKAENKYVEF